MSRSPLHHLAARGLATLVLVALLVTAVMVPPAAAHSGAQLPPTAWPSVPPDTAQPPVPTDEAAWAAQWQAFASAQAALLQWWSGQAVASQTAAAQAATMRWGLGQALAGQTAQQGLVSQALLQARLQQASLPAAAPLAFTPAQLTAGVSPTGQSGIPCNARYADLCRVSDNVQGSGLVRAEAGMTWALTAAVPPGVPAGTVPAAIFTTTKGNAAIVQAAVAAPQRLPGSLESFACAAVTTGSATVACNGHTVGLALQNSQVVVAFAPTVKAFGRVTGPADPLPAPEAQRVSTFTASLYQAVTLTEPLRVQRVFGGPQDQGFAGIVGRFFTLAGLVTSRAQAISGLNLSPSIGVLNTAEFIVDAIVPPGATVLAGLTAGGEPDLPQILVPFQDLSQVQFLQETIRRLP